VKSDPAIIKAIVVNNAIPLICFTALAIVFQKWWIVFFAIIFCAWERKDAQ